MSLGYGFRGPPEIDSDPGSTPFEVPSPWLDDGRFKTERGKILAKMFNALSRDPSSIRYARLWIQSLLPGHNPLVDRLPWMNFKVSAWLESFLTPEMSAFEYGSGGSTMFVASRARSVVSIEHDQFWYDRVAEQVLEDGLTNCTLRLIEPEQRIVGRARAPGPDPPEYIDPYAPHLSFEGYVRSIDEYPDGAFDLVMVDGYARPSCVRHAIPKVRPGGYILVDDTDWTKFEPITGILAGCPRTDFVGVTPWHIELRQTSVWRL